jgi:DnaK suppressor protein
MSSPAAVLEAKKQELQATIARLKSQISESAEDRDGTDAAADDQGSAEAFQEITLESETLQQVEDALKRVADGTYGKCVTCGRSIDPARLKAIPWTPYCTDHSPL